VGAGTLRHFRNASWARPTIRWYSSTVTWVTPARRLPSIGECDSSRSPLPSHSPQ
jgi:hypothetical protein